MLEFLLGFICVSTDTSPTHVLTISRCFWTTVSTYYLFLQVDPKVVRGGGQSALLLRRPGAGWEQSKESSRALPGFRKGEFWRLRPFRTVPYLRHRLVRTGSQFSWCKPNAQHHVLVYHAHLALPLAAINSSALQTPNSMFFGFTMKLSVFTSGSDEHAQHQLLLHLLPLSALCVCVF